MREAISESDLNSNIENTYASLRRLCQMCRRGLMAQNDYFYGLFNEEIKKGFYTYLSNKRICMRFSNDNWAEFLEDYSLFQEGKEPCSSSGKPWLVYEDDWTAVGVLDKMRFFKLIEAFCMPPEYFKPAPAGCAEPKRRFKMYGNGMSGYVWFNLNDDGGLYSCEDPVGKDYILTDETGLRAFIFIDRKGNKGELHNHMDPLYVGHGTIEGYTSSRSRKIYISERYKDEVSFWLIVDNDDREAIYRFPLWKSYHMHSEKFQEIWRDHMQRLKARIESEMGIPL